jgi:hypothetical protein
VFTVLRFAPIERWLPGLRLSEVARSFRGAWLSWSSQPRLAAQTALASLLVLRNVLTEILRLRSQEGRV